MSRHRRVARGLAQTAWAVAGTLSLGLMQWIVVAVVARHDGAAMVGAYALALAVAAPLFTLSMLQLRALLVTAPDPAGARGAYLAARLWTSAAALVASLCCAALIGGTAGVFLVAIGLARCCETVGDLFLGCVQSEGHVDRVGQNQTLLAVVSTTVFCGVVLGTGGVRSAIWVFPLCSSVIALWLPWRQVRASLRPGEPLLTGQDLRPRSVALVVRAGLPLGGSSSLGALGVAVPRFLLQAAHGAAAVGVYSGVSQLSQAVTAVAGAVSQARLPAMVRRFHHGEGEAHLTRVVLASVGVCCAGGLLLAVPAYYAGPALVRLLYGAEFDVSSLVMALLTLATGILSCAWFLDQALVTQRRTRAQLVVNLLGLAVVAGGCALTAAPFGLAGVAAMVTAGAAVQCLAKTLLVLRGGLPLRAQDDTLAVAA